MVIAESLLDILISIIKAHLLILAIIIISFLVEIFTELKLLIDHFKWKKSPRNAEIAANGHTVYYFIFCLAVFIYDIYVGKIESLNLLIVVIWAIPMVLLTIYFRKYYDRYQGIDLNRADDDFT